MTDVGSEDNTQRTARGRMMREAALLTGIRGTENQNEESVGGVNSPVDC
jgi:hypothetical protein